ncbi:MAG: ABC transporter ATP-binding protein [Myxococcota bacterium]
MATHLELRQLSLTYPHHTHPALDAVSATIYGGELVGLLGPNGSGKSTLLKALVGPEALGHIPTTGSVLLHGANPHVRGPLWRARRLAYLPQDVPGELPMTVERLVQLGRYPHRVSSFWGTVDTTARGHAQQIVEASMRRCDVWDMRLRGCMELSGGERQRALLASVLAQQPRTLLLDEPTSALDLRYALQILTILRDLVHDEGCAVVMASHDLNMAARFCTRLLVLDRGRLVADGPPREVLTPKLLAQVYGIEADVVDHPSSPSPWVLPLRPSAEVSG